MFDEKQLEQMPNKILDVCNEISLNYFDADSMLFAFSVISTLLLEALLRTPEKNRMALLEEVRTNVYDRMIKYVENENAKS
jgi:hypothetical protein